MAVVIQKTTYIVINFIFSNWISSTTGSDKNFFSTNGKHFMMSFLPSSQTFSANYRVDLHAKVIGEETVTLELQAPLWSHASAVKTSVQLPPNTDAEVKFPEEIVVPENAKGSSSIVLKSSDDISVIGYQVEVGYASAYVILPSFILGTEYVILTLGSGRSLVNIIAASDGETVVNFTLPKTFNSDIMFESRTYAAGETFTISLSQYENYLIASEDDLSSSFVSGSKPFAVICAERNRDGDVRKYFIMEQALPLHLWGNKFVLTDDFYSTNNTFKVVVAKDTYLTIGTENPVLVQKGTYFVDSLQASSVRLTADAPIMIGKFDQSFDSDRSFAIISPETNFAREFTFTTIPDIGACAINWTVTIIISQSDDVTLGSRLQAPNWQNVPQSKWKFTSVSQSTTSLSIYKISSTQSNLNIIARGRSDGCSSEFSFTTVAVTPVQKWMRAGDMYSTGFTAYLQSQLPYNSPFQIATARSTTECFRICSGNTLCSFVAIETIENDSKKNCLLYNNYLPCYALRFNDGVVIYQRTDIQIN